MLIDSLANGEHALDALTILQPLFSKKSICLIHAVINQNLSKGIRSFLQANPNYQYKVLLRTPSGMGILSASKIDTISKNILLSFEEPAKNLMKIYYTQKRVTKKLLQNPKTDITFRAHARKVQYMTPPLWELETPARKESIYAVFCGPNEPHDVDNLARPPRAVMY